MAERVEAIKAIWAEEEASYHSEHVEFERIWSWPKPLQQPHPPVLVGGNGPTVLDRVLRFGDGWMPNNTGEDLLSRVRELRSRAERPLQVTIMGAPTKPEVLELWEREGIDRAVRWIPSTTRGPAERALERWEDALAEFQGG